MCLQASSLNHKELQAAQSKIDMGVKWKGELSKEIKALEKKWKSIWSWFICVQGCHRAKFANVTFANCHFSPGISAIVMDIIMFDNQLS